MKTSAATHTKALPRRRHPADPVPRLFWSLEETAQRLGISVRSFFELRESHPFYSPDGSRTLLDEAKRDMPLWSDDLVRLIAFARSLTSQGCRQLSDDEGLDIRRAMGNAQRREYLDLVEKHGTNG